MHRLHSIHKVYMRKLCFYYILLSIFLQTYWLEADTLPVKCTYVGDQYGHSNYMNNILEKCSDRMQFFFKSKKKRVWKTVLLESSTATEQTVSPIQARMQPL